MSALQASFESLPLAELFLLLSSNRSTGQLRVVGEQPCSIWFVEGAVAFAERDGDASARELLVRTGTITEADWQAAAGTPEIAAALSSLGTVVVPRLRAVIRERIVDTLFPLLLLPDSAFAFTEGPRHELGAHIVWNAREIASLAADRLERWRTIATSVPSFDAVVRFSPTVPADVESVVVPAAYWPVFARIDGRRTLADVVEVSGLGAYEVCTFLLRLVDDGVVTIA